MDSRISTKINPEIFYSQPELTCVREHSKGKFSQDIKRLYMILILFLLYIGSLRNSRRMALMSPTEMIIRSWMPIFKGPPGESSSHLYIQEIAMLKNRWISKSLDSLEKSRSWKCSSKLEWICRVFFKNNYWF